MLWITCYNKITIRYVYQPLNNKEYKIEIILIKQNEKYKNDEKIKLSKIKEVSSKEIYRKLNQRSTIKIGP